MRRLTLTLSLILIISPLVIGQSDTIYTNNEKIACSVTEVAPDVIKFNYEGESLVNSLYKNSIQKIVFKSGRIQTFSESTSFKTVQEPTDYENVTITQVEGEIKGLYKIGDVSSKAKGTTTLSNQERVKERAYRKLKMQAAMQGANIVYITSQRTEGNKWGGYYQSGSSAEANLSGVAYSSSLPSFNDFEKILGDKRRFVATKLTKLWGSASDLTENPISSNFQIEDIINENGLIVIKGKLEGKSKFSKFKVASFSDSAFNIFFKSKSTVFNVTVKI